MKTSSLLRKLLTATLAVAALTVAGTAQAATTYYDPTATTPNGTTAQIWITAANGFAFCANKGFNTMVDFTGTCGEDESAYLDHVFSSNTWTFRSSGSKNGCYPLFASITCQ